MPIRSLRRTPRAAAAALFVLLGACSAGGETGSVTPPPPAPTPTVVVSAATTALTASSASSGTTVVSIARAGGFAGVVALSVENLPAGVTATFDAPSLGATATSTALTLTVGPTAVAGVTSLTIRASGTGVASSTVALQLTVTVPVPLTPITLTFCDATRLPVFFVVRDGRAGAWRTVPRNGDTYAFTLAGNIGSVSLVWLNPLNRLFQVYETYAYTISGTAADLVERFSLECMTQPARGKALVGRLTPTVATGELAFVSAGWGNALVSPGGSTFSLPDVAPGGIDLIATRYGFNAAQNGYLPTRMILRRGVNQPNGATLPPFDFDGSESFAPATATITIGNQNGERVALRSAFNAPNSAQLVLDNGIQTTASTHTQYGIPAARLLAGDTQEAIVTATDATGTILRQVVATTRAITDRTLTLGSTPNAPVITVTNGAVARPRARVAVQSDYNRTAIALFSQPIARKQAWVEVTPGYLANATEYDLEVPDLSSAPGYNAALGLTVGAQTVFNLWVSNARFGFATGAAGTLSANGDLVLFGSRSGPVP